MPRFSRYVLRLRRFEQGLVVVVHHLADQLRSLGVVRQRARQPRHRRALERRRRRPRHRAAVSEDLHRVPEAHPLRPHHPVDHGSTLAAGAETVPKVLRRSDDERRLLVVVKRTQPEQVLAVRLELHPARPHQLRQVGFLL